MILDFSFFWLLVDGQHGKWNWGGVPSPLNRWYYHTRDFVLQTLDSTQLWNGYVTYQRFGGKRWCCIFDSIYQWLVRFFETNALLVSVSFNVWNHFFFTRQCPKDFIAQNLRKKKSINLVFVNQASYLFLVNNGTTG